MSRSGRSFTLIEMLIVVAVTGIIALVALPSCQSRTRQPNAPVLSRR